MPPRPRLLLVDPNTRLATELAEQLAFHGEFDLTALSSTNDVAGLLDDPLPPELIITASEISSSISEQLSELRPAGLELPLITLSDRAMTDAMAPDQNIIIKPIKLAIFVARIRQRLRDQLVAEAQSMQIGPYKFSALDRELRPVDGEAITLTDKEAAILRVLYRANMKPVPRDMLLGEVWGYGEEITTHTLETHIYRLRQKVEPDSAAPIYLLTDAGSYRLATDV